MENEQLCYNRGCGKSFKNSENGPNCCTFHPGVPFFHDAYKGWSCCNRKCIDFTEFLSMVGCATGFHSNVKPIVEESRKKGDEELTTIETEKVPDPSSVSQMIRPDANTPMTDINQHISPNLVLNQNQVCQESPIKCQPPAKTCLNQGCSMEFHNRISNPVCIHHPGEAVFHEGLKYWSCCKKKSMEFNEFLNQKGCLQGEHLWTSKGKVDCRVDWHQTSTHVILTLYTKGYNFENLKIKTNGVKLNVDVELPEGNFQKEWLLFGIVNGAESLALLQATKVEIKLRKTQPIHWTNLSD